MSYQRKAAAIVARALLCCALAGPAILPTATATSAQTPDEVIRSLAPSAPEGANEGQRLRSVPLHTGQEHRSIWVNYQYARDFSVHFDLGQSTLTPRARQQLMSLGRALGSDRLRPYRYLIAGHTDAIGSPEYNRLLSLRRAESVRAFLVQEFGVDPSRLMVTGWGSEQLKDTRNPHSGVNRRVEIVLVTTRQDPPPAALSSDPPCQDGDPRAARPNLDDFNRKRSGCEGDGNKRRIIINSN